MLTPTEWDLVADLPSIAGGESLSDTVRRRLYPPPIAPEVLIDEDLANQVEDWDEFVRPEMEEAFTRDRDRVRDDLGNATVIPPQEFLAPEQIEEWSHDFPVLKRVEVPLEHTDSWYSALNQARILLNEEHDLANSDDRMLLHMENPGDPAELDQDRILLLAQYELFSAIQVMLVEKVMSPG